MEKRKHAPMPTWLMILLGIIVVLFLLNEMGGVQIRIPVDVQISEVTATATP